MDIPKINKGQFYKVEKFKNSQKPYELLVYYVNKICSDNKEEDVLTGTQAASYAFGNGRTEQHKITKIKNNYKEYFIHFGRKFKLDIPKLFEHHPEIWGVKQEELSVKEQMIKALKHEISAHYARHKYHSINNLRIVSEFKGIFIYKALLVFDSEEDYIQLPEGVRVKYKNGSYVTEVTILEQNPRDNSLIFQTSRELFSTGNPKIEITNSYLLNVLRNNIEELTDEKKDKGPIKTLFSSNPHQNELLTKTHYRENLTKSQNYCLGKSLSNNLNFIWGPPGTGKTYTLARIILNLYLSEEKVLAISVANVAVDGLMKKFIQLAKDYEKLNKQKILVKSQILRVGFIKDKELKNIKEIIPDNDDLIILNEKINELEQKSKDLDDKSKEYAEILSLINQLKRKYSQKSMEMLSKAKIVFTTASKASIDEGIKKLGYENLIVDEGSMMSPVQLYGLQKVRPKRVLVAGDFRQLGPIAISNSHYSEKWIKRSLFHLLGKRDNIVNHPLITMLTEQRRCDEEIISLINSTFYDGKLKTTISPERNVYKHLEPIPNSSVGFIDLRNSERNIVIRTASQSRHNPKSRHEVLKIVVRYIKKEPEATIGIITPYRGQVNMYNNLTRSISEKYQVDFSNLHIGTIHSFQGSEYDIIIFDMVDSRLDFDGKPIPIGNLYFGDTGEQLVNVAVSRAKSKLIFVGDAKILDEGNKRDQVSSKTKNIIRNARIMSQETRSEIKS